MDVLRKIALGLLSPLFIFLLFITALDVGFVRTATHSETVKKLISDSGIYSSVVPSILGQTKTIDTDYGSFSTSDPLIQKAANQAVSPQYIKQNSEAAIDNIYQWLDGKIVQPTFKIDLSGGKASFATSAASVVQQKLSGLPACTTAQSVAVVQAGKFDAVNATCMPLGLSPTSVAGLVKVGILTSDQNFLDKASISADSIKAGANGQPFFQSDKAKQVPKQYQRAKKTPLILSVLTVLTGTGIVFLSRTWQKGLRHVAINLIVVGLVMLVFSWVLNRAMSTKVIPNIHINNALLQGDVGNLISDITHQIDKNYWYFGGLYTLLGASGLAAAQIFKRKNQPALVAASPEQSNSPKVSKI